MTVNMCKYLTSTLNYLPEHIEYHKTDNNRPKSNTLPKKWTSDSWNQGGKKCLSFYYMCVFPVHFVSVDLDITFKWHTNPLDVKNAYTS